MRNFVEQTVRGAAAIAGSVSGAERRRLLAGYARLRFRQGLAQAIPRVRFERTRIHGFDVRFTRPDALLLMVEEIFVRQVYRFEVTCDFVPPRILDCGANVGLATLYFKQRFPDASVVAFEPDPDMFALLRRNVAANGLDGVRLENVALAAADGTVELFRDPDRPAAGSVLRDRLSPAATQVAQVEAKRLSPFVGDRVDFLKLDIEGSERAVLAELAESGALRRVAQIAIEYHHHLTRDEDRLGGFLTLLEEHGFGYQVAGPEQKAFERGRFQDLLIRAYRKEPC